MVNRARFFDQEKDILLIEKIKEFTSCDIIITGDFTSTSLDREYERSANFVQSLRGPDHQIFVVPGNHDRYTFGSKKASKFEQYFSKWQIKTDEKIQYKNCGNYFLILLDQAKPNFLSSRGEMNNEYISLLKQVLDTKIEDKNFPIIVAGHFPLIKSTKYYNMPWQKYLKNAEKLRRILGESQKRIFYLCGHVHKQYCLQDPVYSNIIYISSSAPFKRKDNATPLSFSEIHINKQGGYVINHYMNHKWKRDRVFL